MIGKGSFNHEESSRSLQRFVSFRAVLSRIVPAGTYGFADSQNSLPHFVTSAILRAVA